LGKADSSKVVNLTNMGGCFRPEALVIGRVSQDLVPSTMVVQIIKGECHDLLCWTRRIIAKRQYLRH
jgi:hypothetical protein